MATAAQQPGSVSPEGPSLSPGEASVPHWQTHFICSSMRWQQKGIPVDEPQPAARALLLPYRVGRGEGLCSEPWRGEGDVCSVGDAVRGWLRVACGSGLNTCVQRKRVGGRGSLLRRRDVG